MITIFSSIYNSLLMSTQTIDKRIKIAVIGYRKTGKTSLIRSMMQQTNDPAYKKTLSVDVKSRVRQIGSMRVQFNIWDTVSNSSIFLESRDMSIKNSNVQIVIYRQIEGHSLQSVKQELMWIEQNNQQPQIIIINNKIQSNQTKDDSMKRLALQKRWQYFQLDCRQYQQVSVLWTYLDLIGPSIKIIQKDRNTMVLQVQAVRHKKQKKCICK